MILEWKGDSNAYHHETFSCLTTVVHSLCALLAISIAYAIYFSPVVVNSIAL